MNMAGVAQLVEQRIRNATVAGSTPAAGTTSTTDEFEAILERRRLIAMEIEQEEAREQRERARTHA